VAAPVQRDDVVELDVESLAYGGNGVARLNGYVVFVAAGFPATACALRVTKVKRNHAEALALDVLTPGPQRVDGPCAHYPACGGCRFQDLAYEAQLEQKQRQVEDSLLRLGGIAEPPLEEIVPAESVFHYRNKLEYSFTQDARRPGARFHRAVAGTRCWRSSAAG
jgi:23S rRNA (uracil1939-C5)-methyltransferase